MSWMRPLYRALHSGFRPAFGSRLRRTPLLSSRLRTWRRRSVWWGLGLSVVGAPAHTFALGFAAGLSPHDTAGSLESLPLLWMTLAGLFALLMQVGFACLDAGFVRAKNVVNLLLKKLLGYALSAMGFWAVGFGLMFGVSNGLWGTSHFLLGAGSLEPALGIFLFFQTMLCATAATIVSGAMAERTRLVAHVGAMLLLAGFIYPIFGSWVWGGRFFGAGVLEAPDGGLLAQLGLPAAMDVAGAAVVHSLGGWVALAGALALGPRLGKVDTLGRVHPVLGHNLALAALGSMFVFLGGLAVHMGSASILGGGNSWVAALIGTNLAACAAFVTALVSSRCLVGKPDAGLALNGVLAGVVSISACCDRATPLQAVLIGGVGGVVVVVGVLFLDRVKVDDPVGAISTHGFCGTWATLAAGLLPHADWSGRQFLAQGTMVLVVFVWGFGTGSLMFWLLGLAVGLRSAARDELDGLDLAEHGAEAYPVATGYGPAPLTLGRSHTASLLSMGERSAVSSFAGEEARDADGLGVSKPRGPA